MARGELVELQRRYRRAWRRKQRLLVGVLHWTRPGSVWAMDFTEPAAPIDGLFPEILAVRDLGSGYTLAALPSVDEKAGTALGLLQALARVWGPPLVLKVDNGSAFREHDVKAWAASQGVLPLYSPLYSCSSLKATSRRLSRYFPLCLLENLVIAHQCQIVRQLLRDESVA